MKDDESRRLEAAYDKRDSATYSWFNPGQLYIVQQQERELLRGLRRVGIGSEELSHMDIFEIGCGSGDFLRNLVRWGADPGRCAGADIRKNVIERGKAINPAIRLFHCDCSQTGEESGSYDLVIQNIVFSSVLNDDNRRALAYEMLRIGRTGGTILWCDMRFRNPWNADVRPVRKSELLSLFDGCKLELCKSILLVPPIARKLAPISRNLCDLLNVFPFLRGHYIAAFRKQ